MMLNGLRKNISAFKKEYGRDIIIACDHGHSWRKEWFPHYKASRKKNRDASPIDWTAIYENFNKFREELRENTNYKVITVDRAEADDVIAHFVMKHGVKFGFEPPIAIISGDKDFRQLHKFTNVMQFDPVSKEEIVVADADLYLTEHIIRGDLSDGVPNMLSDDDTFVTGKRQKSMTKKRFEELFAAARANSLTDQGFFRNKYLIDLTNTPKHIRDAIDAKYEEESNKPKKKMLNYFAKYLVSQLFDLIGDF